MMSREWRRTLGYFCAAYLGSCIGESLQAKILGATMASILIAVVLNEIAEGCDG